jgi:hypothetical protein
MLEVMLVEQAQTGELVLVGAVLAAPVEVFHHPEFSKAPQEV